MKLVNLLLGSLALASLGVVMYYSQDNKNGSDYQKYMDFRRKYRSGLVSSPEELDYRFSIFQDNLRKHEEHNRKNSSYTQGVNQFTDLTWEEFKSAYLQEPIQNTDVQSLNAEDNFRKVDYTKYLTPIKNQGQCGSCWSFSTTGALEALYNLSSKGKPSLSEQELVDCSGSYGNYGCNGGLMTSAYKYVKDHKLATEADYPYTARDGTCKRKESGKRYGISSFSTLNATDGEYNMHALQEALNKQPVAVALEVDYGFQAYTGGIYEADDSCGSALNHGVVAVQSGVDGGKRFLKIRNSWGPEWGESGFIRMAYGKPESRGTCGVANSWDAVPKL